MISPIVPQLLQPIRRFLAIMLLCGFHAAQANSPEPARLLHQVTQQHGQSAAVRVNRWLALLQRDFHSEMEMLRAVNHFFNQLPFKPDNLHWKTADYWATPLEFLVRNQGDCEDYALAKYLSLRQLGIPGERLRLVYGYARRQNEAHVLLAYYPATDSEPLLLDNLTPQIQWASRRTDLTPVFSFNEQGYWLQSRHIPLAAHQVPRIAHQWRRLLRPRPLLSANALTTRSTR